MTTSKKADTRITPISNNSELASTRGHEISLKDLKHLRTPIKEIVATRQRENWRVIEEIQESPYSYKPLSGQLVGTKSARVGELRVVYAVDEREKRVILLYVGRRERVYEH